MMTTATRDESSKSKLNPHRLLYVLEVQPRTIRIGSGSGPGIVTKVLANETFPNAQRWRDG